MDNTKLNETLTKRGGLYGPFVQVARTSCSIKRAMRHAPNWDRLPDDMAEALDMVANKMARILCGDFNYSDSWFDMEGYVRLIQDRLDGVVR